MLLYDTVLHLVKTRDFVTSWVFCVEDMLKIEERVVIHKLLGTSALLVTRS